MIKNDTRCIPDIGLTHSGEFHADDVFSAALLRLLNPDIKFIRTRNIPEDFKGIIFDVGYGEFDHHQNDNEKRPNDIPYASFGKLWQAFGNRLVSEKLVEKIDKEFIQDLDLSDNKGTYNPVAEIISGKNPSWTDPNANYDEKFEEAVELAMEMLQSVIDKEKDIELAEQVAEKAILDAKCKEIIILPQYAPVDKYLIHTEAKFLIFPSSNDEYMFFTIAQNEKDNPPIAKLKLPQEWSSLRNEDLTNVNNIEDMVFCHRELFCGAAKTLEAAVKAAVVALNEEVKYDKKFDEGVRYIMSGIERQVNR